MGQNLIDYATLEDGTFVEELNERIEQAVRDIKSRPMVDKKRKIKMTLTIDPGGNVIDISQVVKMETPPESVDTTVYLEEEKQQQTNLINMNG